MMMMDFLCWCVYVCFFELDGKWRRKQQHTYTRNFSIVCVCEHVNKHTHTHFIYQLKYSRWQRKVNISESNNVRDDRNEKQKQIDVRFAICAGKNRCARRPVCLFWSPLWYGRQQRPLNAFRTDYWDNCRFVLYLTCLARDNITHQKYTQKNKMRRRQWDSWPESMNISI